MEGRDHQLAFLMLAHEHPRLCARLARHLLEDGHRLVIHLDRKADDHFRSLFDEALGARSAQVEWCERWSVAWGEWTMVQATLSGLETLAASGTTPDHVYLISGADYPLRPLSELHAFLQRHRSRDFIEHRDVRNGRWVKRGPQESRYEAWHFFNWRSRPRLFSWSLKLQHRLGVRRKLPAGLQPHFGSQWWVLSWQSCKLAMDLGAQHDIQRFFKRSWVPDELFFQSVVATRRDPAMVDQRHLTYYQFTPFGVPLVLHDGHEAFLEAQPFFFARKLDPHADQLRAALDRRLANSGALEKPDDRSIGYATEDYDLFLHRHRHGIHGQRSWGHPGDPCLGALARNRKAYRVLLSAREETLNAALAQLGRSPDITVHGQLFARDQIDFISAAENFAGYDKAALAIRDQDRSTFLNDVLALSPGQAVGFGVLLDHGANSDRDEDVPAAGDEPAGDRSEAVRLLARLYRDPRCELIHLDEPGDGERLFASLQDYTEAYWPNRQRARCTQSPWVAVDKAGPGADEDLPGAGRGDAQAAQPLQRRPKRLILHIGVHRTGTTAIQRLLHANREQLKAQGIHYGFDTENHTWLASGLQGSDEAAEQCVNSVIDDALKAGEETTIISGEDLCRIVHVDRLAPFLDHFEVDVVVYLRRQDSWLESWYNQNIRWPWELETSHFTPAVFLQRRERFHWLDYGAMVRRWCDVFGQDKVKVRVFEEARQKQPFTDDFCDLCGIDAKPLLKPKRAQNASVSPAAGELLRHLHLFSRDPIDRMVLIRLTAEAYARQGLDSERHIYDTETRQRIQYEFAASNRWVARAMLDREDGRLFPTASFDESAPAPELDLLPAEQLLGSVGRDIANALLTLIDGTPPGPELDEQTRENLLRLEFRRRQLRGLRNILDYQLTPRRPLLSNLKRLEATVESFGVEPRSSRQLPLNAADPGSSWSRAALRLAEAMGWQAALAEDDGAANRDGHADGQSERRDRETSDEDQQRSLRIRQTLRRWQALAGPAQDAWTDRWPPAAQLVADVLEPLLDILLTELSVVRRLSDMNREDVSGLQQKLERRLKHLERRLTRLEGARRSRFKRLLYLLFRDDDASDRRQDEMLVGKPDPLPDEPGPAPEKP